MKVLKSMLLSMFFLIELTAMSGDKFNERINEVKVYPCENVFQLCDYIYPDDFSMFTVCMTYHGCGW